MTTPETQQTEYATDNPIPEQSQNSPKASRAEPGKAGPGVEGTRDAWDRIAIGYDTSVTPTHEALAEEGLRRAGLAKGDRFLDVAAGSGALSLPAARIGARVLATDYAPAMLERLKERARSAELSIETRVMDGHALELEDDSFDVAGSQFGVMLFPDLPRALREMARVVKPGGRVLVHAFGNPGSIEFISFLVAAVRSVRPQFSGPPSDPPPLEFQLADPEKLRSCLADAGLGSIRVEAVTETLEFRNGQELWKWLIHSNPIVENLLSTLDLSAGEREAIQHALEPMVEARADTDGVARLTSPVNIGIGTK